MAAANIVVPEHAPSGCKELVEVLCRVGDKWTILVVGALSQGPVRYNEIRRRVGSISQRMLTLTLKGLEQDGLVNRTLYPTIPPRVEYELTDLGRTLKESLAPLHAWASRYKPDIAQARKRFAEKDHGKAKATSASL